MVSEPWRDLRPPSATSGEIGGTTGYIEYFQARQLHTLQRPITESAYEMAFVVSSQVMELYFGLLCHEFARARREVRDNDVRAASSTLRRSVSHLRALEGTWESYADMMPADWNPIKARLGKGESSSVHSYMYRHMVFLLGLKSVKMLEPHQTTPLIHEGLHEALRAPSLYDEVLALIQRRGLELPDAAVHRDFAEPYVIRPEVEAAWLRIYREEAFADLRTLGEQLTQVSEHYTLWLRGHLRATVRTFGAKPGYYGTDASAWLRRGLDQPVFPELWTARTAM
ncbi:tryptophan 2,3-dioxygenase family protein [Streptomyces tendae]|uniref:tryptophan 2,3-dioxygenase n=1 Tax=Streptomyces tendae TaxID=1932 RepID=UPI0033E53C14